MISYNYKKHLRAALLLQRWNEAGHFEHYKYSIQKYIDEIIKFYLRLGLQRDYKDVFMKSAIKIEDSFEKNGIIGYSSNTIFVLSMTIAVAEAILSKTRNENIIKIWSDLLDYCKSNLPINYLIYLEHLEIAGTVADIVTETEM